jgi:hypothetical protein
MTDENSLAPYLDLFPGWLEGLGRDAGELGKLVNELTNEVARRYVIGGLNYIFKSLDLIPDGIDDLGLCDDAFVIRVAARLACTADETARRGVLAKLADEAAHVEAFLEGDYARLATYVEALRKGAARGRMVDDILSEPSTRTSFLNEVESWAAEYQPPAFSRDVKTLIKLRAFLAAKLA